MPEAHRCHNEWQPSHLREWGNGIGDALAHVVYRQPTERPHPEHGDRACLGLRKLARRFGPERLEAACRKALELATTNSPRIRAILEHGLEGQPSTPGTEARERRGHANVRSGAYYTAEPS